MRSRRLKGLVAALWLAAGCEPAPRIHSSADVTRRTTTPAAPHVAPCIELSAQEIALGQPLHWTNSETFAPAYGRLTIEGTIWSADQLDGDEWLEALSASEFEAAQGTPKVVDPQPQASMLRLALDDAAGNTRLQRVSWRRDLIMDAQSADPYTIAVDAIALVDPTVTRIRLLLRDHVLRFQPELLVLAARFEGEGANS